MQILCNFRLKALDRVIEVIVMRPHTTYANLVEDHLNSGQK